MVCHMKAAAQGVGTQAIYGQRAQPSAIGFVTQQGGCVGRQYSAQGRQQAAVAFVLGHVAGQFCHQWQQGVQQRGVGRHSDIVCSPYDCS